MTTDGTSQTILVTGASGYIGGRLVPRLLEQGHRVRAMSRDVARLRGRDWRGVELVEADALDPDSLAPALEGVDTAYYLIHSMEAGPSRFVEQDRLAARRFGEAARAAGVKHIVYLGGLGADGDTLSHHLASRAEVGRILTESGVSTTIFRAATIIGSGSVAFETLYHLVKQLPFMVTPRWVSTRTQPIAIRDVLLYLVGVLDRPSMWGRRFDIGGPDVLSYRDMIAAMGVALGKRVRVLPMPFLTPSLSAFWIAMFSPVDLALIRSLIEGLRNEVVVQNDAIDQELPIAKTSFAEALRLALTRVAQGDVETHWSGTPGRYRAAFLGRVRPPGPGEKRFTDCRERTWAVDAPTLYRAIAQVGGDVGWYYATWLWKLRALLDWAVGGPGFRPGRRHPQDLLPGDAVNFWRVEAVEVPTYVLLRAEFRQPGTAWLEFRAEPLGPGVTRLVQTAHYNANGFWGRAYWYAVSPFHYFIFNGLITGIGKAALTMRGPLDVPAPAASARLSG